MQLIDDGKSMMATKATPLKADPTFIQFLDESRFCIQRVSIFSLVRRDSLKTIVLGLNLRHDFSWTFKTFCLMRLSKNIECCLSINPVTKCLIF